MVRWGFEQINKFSHELIIMSKSSLVSPSNKSMASKTFLVTDSAVKSFVNLLALTSQVVLRLRRSLYEVCRLSSGF